MQGIINRQMQRQMANAAPATPAAPMPAPSQLPAPARQRTTAVNLPNVGRLAGNPPVQPVRPVRY